MVDDVPADEVRDTSLVAAPVVLPVGARRFCPLLRERYVTDRRVDPDVNNQVIASGELHAPVERPGDAPVVQELLHPPKGVIPGGGRAPEVREVLEEEVAEGRELEEVVLLLPVLRLPAADLADRILDLAGLQVLPAPLVALVAPGDRSAVGTDPLHIAVGEEPLALRAVTLADGLSVDVAILDEPLDDRSSGLVVHGIVRHPEPVEDDIHPPERLVEVLVIALREGAWGRALLLGADHDRRSVVVGTADKDNFLPGPAHIPHIKVRRHVGPQMPDMAGTVRVREPTRYQQRLTTHPYLLWSRC
ncbi:hypothetical protein DSECCO2_620150 [anaerobic digester metagenome]